MFCNQVVPVMAENEVKDKYIYIYLEPGITYLEKLQGSEKWYWGTDYTCGDLYEAEEVFRNGKSFVPNRLIFVHYPEGIVFEPIKSREYQYFGMPACIDGVIYFLLVNFEEGFIRMFQCSDDMKKVINI